MLRFFERLELGALAKSCILPRRRHFGFFGSVSWIGLFIGWSSFMNNVLWSVEHWMLLVRRWQHWLAINYVELHCNSWPIRTGGQIFHRCHLCRPAFFSRFTYLSRNCSPQALAALFWETQTHPGFLVLCIINWNKQIFSSLLQFFCCKFMIQSAKVTKT